MGFSVSGTFAVLILTGLLTIGMVYTAAADGFVAVTDAHEENVNDLRLRANTAISMTDFVLDEGNGVGTVNVDVWNNGSTALLVDRTELLVDGETVTTEATFSVCLDDGSCSTTRTVWQPGERLHIEVTRSEYFTSTPDRAKVVTENDASDAMAIQGVL